MATKPRVCFGGKAQEYPERIQWSCHCFFKRLQIGQENHLGMPFSLFVSVVSSNPLDNTFAVRNGTRWRQIHRSGRDSC